ncbi:hypothetical protein QJS04_geneDACA012708 [Acorus gramineus]|uniref:Uncharacterized protein n=1 Tax=Acorus gramineus TaxID=55184 RepID=A0AAV9B5H7_ACOGR|nr:hypothetical protein QJS04_geneDACA012708 [Acorus gramineus]
MRVLGDSWCFCSGGAGSRSERLKGAIFGSKAPAMARISGGTGFLIHRNLLLTTHANLPTVAAAETADVRMHGNKVSSTSPKLVPHRFFITSTVLDLTIVGFDMVEVDSASQSQQPHHLKTCSNPTLNLGNTVYILGHTGKENLTVGDGKVVIATDNLIKLSTDGVTWCPGSAGFDSQGNLAFMICDPMKLATSPTTKSSSVSSSSSQSCKDSPMQFGIPIPIICDWLNQHWEGSFDELSKPKLPIMRLMSTSHKNEHSSASFTQHSIFKPEGENDDNASSSSHRVTRPAIHQPETSSSGADNMCEEETPFTNKSSSTHEQGIPTPEIYESRMLVSGPIQRKRSNPTQLLDINFPPKLPQGGGGGGGGGGGRGLPLPIRQLLSASTGNDVNPMKKAPPLRDTKRPHHSDDAEIASVGSPSHSEVQSSSPQVEVMEPWRWFPPDDSSEVETMYSAETMESRNCPNPKKDKPQPVGRSQSSLSYNSRWSSGTARRGILDKQRSFIPVKKMGSQTASSSQRGHEFFSPTVSSIMKKRNNNPEPQPVRPVRHNAVQVSPRWMF